MENKVAIITGAGSGIGRATALIFSREGAKILVADWSDTGGKETVEQIKKEKGEAIFVKTDVSNAENVNKMADICLAEFGRIDILVNNAGIVKFGPLHETSESDWDTVLNVNLKSVFLCSKKVIPGMLKQGGGKIVNVSSIAGLVGFDQIGSYCASKGGIIALTREMALEYAPRKININCIAPGVIKTAMTKDMIADPAQRQFFESSTPYPRLGESEDIAMATVYLASGESDFVAGEVLVVDGGWTIK
ncbi:MAG: short-chain dehydrogenase [Candidatus Nealsonbacteria bacterium RIFCSPLOWO2_12_FULL_39_31]|uniref:Short-chain dehydrogenase n=3 Tax=Candidatus Nealsoniibacteriota TaxID=1817911 RepID=A0A1G2EI48_9BACT|nr:MAG: short-chain dehydrogenase [Candidatus Nealsonbacteria bacterium RIFCSPHIGHO2_01_FULL_38_55]OGZ21674.1 MAG: short-chain dehydrogenase [Candidatus Nealsonbacteria bacterium RIFCSPHIGHO2_02_38_10]OGZ22152.1 MAG: short-chain dehydrogenase [Candidatus Nealsonbacteria bacterium RIFCSPHIGHO2_02_FULL_38_75]OGZ22525.1 MAG: short-chain dehydrogenase [Candidatus Nealsonbacteria bacterium RIFCSPHIGHO2_12_FULL_38_18]OGZ23665.1 MAG: short-chain dehydrogenase [Candidatus Nealsonbacteria bacterium RIFC